MAKNPDQIKFVTPAGVASWPKLNTPDIKWDPRGKYTAKIYLEASDPAVIELVARLEKCRDDFLTKTVAELKADKKAALAVELKPGEVIKIDRDQETGEETGKLIFQASMLASGTRKDGSTWTQKPSIFGAKGNALANPPMISGGSELKLSVEVEPFINQTSKQAVLSVRLKAVQVIKLSSGGVRSFGEHGFEAEEGDDIADVQTFGDESGGAADTAAGNDDL